MHPGWRGSSLAVVVVAGCVMSSCAAPAARRPSTPRPRGAFETREGLASYYGKGFHGKTTASGVRFDMNAMVAAHPTYPFGTRVRVTSVATRKSVQVRIVDRGPARSARADGVIIDLSQGAASRLGFIRAGRTRVRVEVLEWGR